MKRLWLIVGSVAGLALVVIVMMLIAPKPPIPGPIKQKLSSTLLVPKASVAVSDRSTVKYDDKLKLVSWTLTTSGTQIVISEQPTPESFTDIPQVFDKVVANMQEYQKFDVDVGTVHLTRPPQLGGKQAAVLNTKGTLLFAKPDSDLTDDQWRKFFTSFAVVK